MQIPSLPLRRIILGTLTVALVMLGFWLIHYYSTVLVLVLLGAVIGTVFKPALNLLGHKGLSKEYGLTVVFLLIGAILLGVIFLGLPTLADQTSSLVVEFPEAYSTVRRTLLDSSSQLLRSAAVYVPPFDRLLTQGESGTEESLDLLARFYSATQQVGRSVLLFLAVVILAFFWSLESDRVIRSLLLLLSPGSRDKSRQVISTVEEKLGAYVRGQLILASTIFVCSLIAYTLIGLPNALVLAILAGLFEMIPVVGPAIGAIPALLIALAIDPLKALWVLAAAALIQVFENYLLAPRVMRADVGVHPMLTLLSLVALGSLFGIAGAMLAIPLAAVFQLVLERWIVRENLPSEPELDERDRLSVLRYEARALASDVRKQIRNNGDAPEEGRERIEDEIEILALELDQILGQPPSQGETG